MSTLQGKRIFYVEDNVGNRAIALMILEHHGAIVEFERWVQQDPLGKLKEFMPIDLILLDLMFPKNVTGYDIFDAIQKDPTLRGIPVAAVSAADPAVEVPKTRSKGFAGFISKPVDMRQFPEQIAALIDGKQIWDEGLNATVHQHL